MDDKMTKTIGKTLRPVRNRRYSRKSLCIGQKTAKRLFTPEIKKYLKEWLVRRRDNPYPNREEKKQLAIDTGLTYIQICNWFANWRRKLKNASDEKTKKTWGHLIKTYNCKARGNVEQFSISSDDSIWGEPDPESPDASSDPNTDHCYTVSDKNKCESFNKCHLTSIEAQVRAQCYDVSSTTEEYKKSTYSPKFQRSKYKSHMMEKYLKGLELEMQSRKNQFDSETDEKTQPLLLSKWLESAENFQPRQNNYVKWISSNKMHSERNCLSKNIISNDLEHSEECYPRYESITKPISCYHRVLDYKNMDNDYTVYDTCIHGREEVEAAVALTHLASMFRS